MSSRRVQFHRQLAVPFSSCLSFLGVPGEVFASVEKALDERTIGHNPERLSLMKASSNTRFREEIVSRVP